jgi:UTP-glucose-1-phosphate uridylyltransferase
MNQTLVVLAAGLSTRYGGNKQLASVGPSDEVLLDYAVYDAARAGFTGVTFVIRQELERDFQEHVALRFGTDLQVNFAYQELLDLPEKFELPDNRVKPWGTAHAILAVRKMVGEPFVVINADDFYGRSAYVSLHDFLEHEQGSNAPQFAMIGYTLRETLSEFGGVSRGICKCDDRGFLEQLVEVKEIDVINGKISGVTTAGEGYSLQGHETVSMNIWALSPAVFPILEKQFAGFLCEHGADPDAEFLISSALNQQVTASIARLKVIAAAENWFGMTFQADRPNVIRKIASLVEHGVYPESLTSWFQGNR